MLMLNGKHSFVIFEANKVPLDSRYVKSQGKYTTFTADKITLDGDYDEDQPKLLIKGTIAPNFNQYKTIHILAKASVNTSFYETLDGKMRVENSKSEYITSYYQEPHIIVNGKIEKEYTLDISPTTKSFQFSTLANTTYNKWAKGEITKIWLDK